MGGLSNTKFMTTPVKLMTRFLFSVVLWAGIICWLYTITFTMHIISRICYIISHLVFKVSKIIFKFVVSRKWILMTLVILWPFLKRHHEVDFSFFIEISRQLFNGMYIHGPKMMNFSNFDLLTSHLASSSGQNVI